MELVFTRMVLKVVKRIPKGSVLTYGEVARRAGKPKAARAVGAILRANADLSVPCHRVVRADGIGGYNGLRGDKGRLLEKEGVVL